MTDSPTLFATEPTGLVRHTDPVTSVEAARSVDATAIRAAILTEFRAFGWLTDDELCGLLFHLLPASVKTARSRLKAEGRIVATGTKRPSNTGHAMTVWRLATEYERING